MFFTKKKTKTTTKKNDKDISTRKKTKTTRQSKQCGFSIYTFDNLKSKSMSGLFFARRIARVILIQHI